MMANTGGSAADREARTAASQVSRMLALVPYVTRRPGVSIGELADEFGVDTDQITADLNLLMVCGEPGYYPNELIDVVLDEAGGTVSIAYDAGIDRPVRLSTEEAVALTAALRALGDIPGLIDADAVHSALGKLEHAVGTATPNVVVRAADPAPALATVREALDAGRRLWMRYYTASRDEVTEREVDPIRVLVVDGHAYVEGYCYLAEAIRRFRIDRIDEVTVLAAAAQPVLWVDDSTPDELFTPGEQAPAVTLRLDPSARWVAEYYAVESMVERADPPGAVEARLRAGSEEWIVRLVTSLGGAARIVDRDDLARRVRDHAAAALAAYPGRDD